jgi:hypothetical protein
MVMGFPRTVVDGMDPAQDTEDRACYDQGSVIAGGTLHPTLHMAGFKGQDSLFLGKTVLGS